MSGPKTEDNGRPTKTWTGPAIASATIGVLGIVFAVVVALRNWGDQDVQRRVEPLRAKARQLEDRKSQIRQVPIVEVKLRTLDDSGMPHEVLQSLPERPALLSITHAGGETARDLIVSIRGRPSILRYRVLAAVNETDCKLDAESEFLSVSVPLVRPGTETRIAIDCAKPGMFSLECALGSGRLLLEDTGGHGSGNVGARLGYEAALGIDIGEVHSLEHADALISECRRLESAELGLKLEERGDLSWFVWIFPAVSMGVMFAVLDLAAKALKANRRGMLGDRLGNKIGYVVTEGLLKNGDSAAKAMQLLGHPKRIDRSQSGVGTPVDTWVYEPAASSRYGWQPDLKLTVEDDVIVNTTFSQYGARRYVRPPDLDPQMTSGGNT